MTNRALVQTLLASRKSLRPRQSLDYARHPGAAEGGCGVIGMACSERIPARHLLQALDQMRNRGNGKGGGIAAVGLDPEAFGVSQAILDQDYLLAVAYLDESVRPDLEAEFIHPVFEVDHVRRQPHLPDHTRLQGLEVRPPEIVQYFVHPKPEVVEAFTQEHGLETDHLRRIEDELVYQNTYRLNARYYAATGDTQAFVLSHGKNILVAKMVGYGDDVIRYYKLEDLGAHVWIGHHRYPTKGRVWHPGGAHPFVGLNEALVHNGDFANYASICEYLAQRNIYPQFLTDTEVSVLVFDLLERIYDYPLEYVIEALAPTTERDFVLLPEEKQKIYQLLQTAHMHSSPDGPWFFLIAQSDPGLKEAPQTPDPSYRLIGITDTSMLRPQVFAWQETGNGGPAIGFAASEKQAIDAALSSLAESDPRFWSRADRYWNARGGSHTDGGAFLFSVRPGENGIGELVCSDKFGRQIDIDTRTVPYAQGNGHDAMPLQVLPDNALATIAAESGSTPATMLLPTVQSMADRKPAAGAPAPRLLETNGASAERKFSAFAAALPKWDYEEVIAFLQAEINQADTDSARRETLDLLTYLIDRRYPTGHLRPSSLLSICDHHLAELVEKIRAAPTPGFAFVDRPGDLPEPATAGQAVLVLVDARRFAPEGQASLAMAITQLVRLGFKHLIVVHARGQRFIGNGLGPASHGIRIDVYGSSGDYLGSGIDGTEIFVHGNAQDQLAQIIKAGKLVIYGDVGQTFMYAAKGGEAYVLGNAAGRPLINAVGKPRVVINGTCLDYLAESFMAGDPGNGGGFVILNGITFDGSGEIIDLESPYPGGNLFSLASGGAIFVRDPRRLVSQDQLNGGELSPVTPKDWQILEPYLKENEALFGIPIARLLEVDGASLPPEEIYCKVLPKANGALQAEEAWKHSWKQK